MNANALNKLTKLYDTLSPGERVPLWLAARARGDEAERQRLARSAPRKTFRVADTHGLLQGLRTLAAHHAMLQLNLVSQYWIAFSALCAESEAGSPDWQELRMTAYHLVANAALWQCFCADLEIDPDLLLKDFPGHATVKFLEEAMRSEAFTEEEALAYLRRRYEAAEAVDGRAPATNRVYRMRPVAEQVKELREILDLLAKPWQ
jgi:hypothetical protein